MRSIAVLVVLLAGLPAPARAQGRVLEHGRGGGRAELQRSHAEVRRDLSQR